MARKPAGTQFHPLTYSVPFVVDEPHGHVNWEFTMIKRGKVYNYINGTRFICKQGDLFLIGPSDRHYFKAISEQDYEHRDIYVEDKDLRELCNVLSPTLYNKITEKPMAFFIQIGQDEILKLDNRLRLLQAVDADHITESQLAIHKSLVIYLLGLYIEKNDPFSQRYPEWILKLIIDMQQSEVLESNLSSLIKSTHYSREYVSREFHRYTGVRLIDYFTRAKLNFAASLLANTEYSVLNISSRLGYSSLSHFIHLFKKYNGISPGVYRRQRKSNRKYPAAENEQKEKP